MNLRPEKINAHADWTSDKIHNIEKSRIGSDRPAIEPRSYFEKVAAFYLVHTAEMMRAEAVLRQAGISQKTLDDIRAIAEDSVPDELKNAPAARGWFMSRWMRVRGWVTSKFTWDDKGD